MRKLKLSALIIIALVAFQNRLSAQCGDCLGFISATVTDTLVCQGGVVQITSQGSPAAYYNDFNTMTLGVGWSSNATPQFNNPCDPPLDGTPYLWMGNSTSFPRTLETIDMNVSGGGNISFDFDMATQGFASPCEGPDLTVEGVYLDFSTDGGGSWINIFYFQPDAGGTTGPYLTWANYSFPIPPEAQTQCTRFRWNQASNSTEDFDHWGVDNIQIGPSAGGPYTLYWQGNPLFPTDTTTSLNVTADTTMILVLQTVADTCYDTISIHVIPLPNAALSITNPYCVADPVVFNATGSTPSADITNYLYDLDNNGTYEVTTPGSVYNAPGTFENTAGNKVVHMIIQTAEPGCTDTIVTTVQIYNLPTVGLSAVDPTVCLYNDAAFSALAFMFNASGQSSTVANYEWDFNFDGTIDTSGTSLSNTTYHFPGTGTYPVVVTVTSSVGCERLDTVSVTIVDIPHGNIVAPQVCGNLPASFSFNNTGLPVSTYGWNFGDLTTLTDVSTASAPTYQYPASGTYPIVLIAGTSDGCLDTLFTTVTIAPLPAGTITNTDQCQGLDEIFVFAQTSSDTIVTYAWTFPAGTPSSSSTASPTVSFGFGGTVNVSVIVTNQEGCMDTVNSSFIVHPTPSADFAVYPVCISRFTFDPFISPTDSSVTLNWDLGDGTIILNADTNVFNHVYPAAGDYLASMTITSQYGCTNFDSAFVHVDDTMMIIMPNVLVQSSTMGNDRVDMDVVYPDFNLCVEYTYTVFDRWGVQVYQTTNDPYNPDVNCGSCFKGKAKNGATLTPGVYFYVMQGNYNIVKSGSITIFE